VDGAVHVADHDHEPVDVPPALLPSNYDELISYVRDPSDRRHLIQEHGTIMRAGGLLFVHGRVAGSWTRAMRSSSVTVTVRPGVPLDSPAQRAIEQGAAAFVARWRVRPRRPEPAC